MRPGLFTVKNPDPGPLAFLSIDRCPKCGSRLTLTTVSVEYQKGLDLLDCTCTRCGYDWFEFPLDKEDSE